MKGRHLAREAERSLDAYLVAAVRAGERTAERRLVSRWHPKMMAHAWRLLGERDAAEEAVQEAWVEIVRALPRLAEPRAFSVWALRIVSRRCARTCLNRMGWSGRYGIGWTRSSSRASAGGSRRIRASATFGPTRGLSPIRLMWSEIRTRSPRSQTAPS